MNLSESKPNIIFMGTPEFSIPSLKAIYNKWGISAVVTVPDKPKGRGRKLQASPVKEFALENNIKVLQPESLKNEEFIAQIKAINPDIICVIAFRILPEAVYSLSNIASYNIHGSLLPKYRGAAPINWAIINGETKTGLSSFILQKKVDTGELLLKKEIDLKTGTTAGELHDKLMYIAADLSLETIDLLIDNDYQTLEQDDKEASPAPKIFKNDCLIDWNKNAEILRNFIHGLSPYPAAWTTWNDKTLKILRVKITENDIGKPGQYKIENDIFYIMTADYTLEIVELKIEGKRAMKTKDFLKGYRGDLSGIIG